MCNHSDDQAAGKLCREVRFLLPCSSSLSSYWSCSRSSRNTHKSETMARSAAPAAPARHHVVMHIEARLFPLADRTHISEAIVSQWICENYQSLSTHQEISQFGECRFRNVGNPSDGQRSHWRPCRQDRAHFGSGGYWSAGMPGGNDISASGRPARHSRLSAATGACPLGMLPVRPRRGISNVEDCRAAFNVV